MDSRKGAEAHLLAAGSAAGGGCCFPEGCIGSGASSVRSRTASRGSPGAPRASRGRLRPPLACSDCLVPLPEVPGRSAKGSARGCLAFGAPPSAAFGAFGAAEKNRDIPVCFMAPLLCRLRS